MLVGVDVTSVDRVTALVSRSPRFIARVFTESEQRDCARLAVRWASTWAAKEAVRKLHGAAGVPLPAYRDVEVHRRRGAAPAVLIGGGLSDIALSLTHDAGIAAAVAVSESLTVRTRAPALLRLPPRPDDGHKGSFGRVLVIAGARGFTGAPVLAALGAARGGAGLVTVAVPESIYAIVAARCLEVMPLPLDDDGHGVLSLAGLAQLRDHISRADAVVLGPGLGRAAQTGEAVAELLGALPCPAVVDADALNLVAENRLGWTHAERIVITPHPTEMSRLIGTETAVVQADRQGIATAYAQQHGVTVVLKGSQTVIASPDGRVHIDAHRVVALASGGTGDVLAGLLASLLAQGLQPFDAALAAVSVHAEAGVLVQALRGRAGALASDVIDSLPQAQERLRRALDAGYLL